MKKLSKKIYKKGQKVVKEYSESPKAPSKKVVKEEAKSGESKSSSK